MPTFVWHLGWQLTAGKRERMWRVLQAVLAGEEHTLATTRKCGRRGPILVLDTDFEGAAHGTVRRVMKEGVSLEVMHVRRKDMKEYRRAGLHQAEFYREKGGVEWGVYNWLMPRVRGHETRTRWDRQTPQMGKEWVAQWRITKKAKRRRGGERVGQKRRCWTGEQEKRQSRSYCCVLHWDSKAHGGRYKVRADSDRMYMRICSGETTSRGGQWRGTSAGDAQRGQGRCRS